LTIIVTQANIKSINIKLSVFISAYFRNAPIAATSTASTLIRHWLHH